MTEHIHVSTVTMLALAAQLLIIGFFFRVLAMRWPDSSFAKALAFIY